MDSTEDSERELKWEANMIDLGLQRFRIREEKALESKSFTRTNSGARLMRNYVAQVSELISHYIVGNSKDGRRRSKYTKLLTAIDVDKLALISLSSIVSAVYEEITVTSAALTIGGQIEDEIRFTEFRIAHAELFSQLQRDLDSRNSENYRHRQRVLSHSMNKANVEWKAWPSDMRAGVGTLVLSLALDATDLVRKHTVKDGRNRSSVKLTATPEVMEWMRRSDASVAMLLPDRMPMLTPPEDWTSSTSGGYLLPKLRQNTPLIKFRYGEAGRIQCDLVNNSSMEQVMNGVNTMQSTPWRINQRVLEIMQQVWENDLQVGMPPSQPYVFPVSPIPEGVKDIPEELKEDFIDWKQTTRELHTKERDRKSTVLGVSRTMRVGQMLKEYEQFYFVYQLDFRGRAYCTTSGVSPQGADTSKSCLEFAEGKTIGKTGAYWLKVHGANKFGFDKVSYADRVEWVKDNHQLILETAEDPLSNRSLWGNADKPYQFLAFCFEYQGFIRDGEDFVSRLPIALDGSCNGIQHFSAMLRDPVGAKSVNLMPSDVPADIYQDVADTCTQKIHKASEEGVDTATNWLQFLKSKNYAKLPRAASKRPVMTLPYGATQQACTSSLFSWYTDHDDKFFPPNTGFRHCIYLSSLLWESIGEVVVAARGAMTWMQHISGDIAQNNNQAISYTTPLGFPMYQASPNQIAKRVSHSVGGSRLRLNIMVHKDGLDVRKQRQGSAPNLVHSIDATHMFMCVNAGSDAGIKSFAMIHDDFGTHACYTEQWHKIIREQFVKLHTENNILSDLHAQLTAKSDEDIMEPPQQSDFDLNQVLISPCFFG